MQGMLSSIRPAVKNVIPSRAMTRGTGRMTGGYTSELTRVFRIHTYLEGARLDAKYVDMLDSSSTKP